MSTQPTIISIVDQIDPTIAVKINGIASASRNAANEVNNLQGALDRISGNSAISGLAASLARIAPVATATAQSVNNVTKAVDTVTSSASKGEASLLKLSKALGLPQAPNVQELSKALAAIPATALSADDKILGFSRSLGTVTTVADNAVVGMLNLSKGLGVLSAAAKPDPILALGSALSKVPISTDITVDSVQVLSRALGTIPTPVISATEKLGALARSLGTTPASADITSQSVLVLSKALGTIPSTADAAQTGLLKLSKSLSTTPISRVVLDVGTLSKALGTIPVPAKNAAVELLGLSKGLAAGSTTAVPAVVNLLKLSQGLGTIPGPAKSAWQQLLNLGSGTGTFTSRIANLLGRVVGMEAGLGRLGGAFAAVGVSAAGAGPFIIAALAVGAVLGAIVLYEKFREEANALLETQTALGKQFNSINDRILDQKERLADLTGGPLAQYAQQLKDLPLKSIDIDLSNVQKELEQQHSWWATVVSDIERFASARAALDIASNAVLGVPLSPLGSTASNQTPAFDIRDTERFLLQQEQMRQAGTQTHALEAAQLKDIVADAKKAAEDQTFNKKAALENELAAVHSQMDAVQKLIQTSSGKTKEINQVSFNALKDAYRTDLLAYREYLGKKNVLQAEAGRAAVSEQLKQFTEEMDRFKASVPNGIVTAQDELKLRQQQLSGATRPTQVPGLDSKAALSGVDGGNVQKLTDDINKLTAEINKQGFQVDILVKKYQDGIQKAGAYSDALKVEAEYEHLLTEVQAKRIPLTDELSKRLRDVATQGVEDAKVNRELVAIYNEFQGPIQTYGSTVKATTELLKENAITADQAAVANARAARAMQDAIDPLNEYKIGLQHEVNLLGLYGTQLSVATEIDRVRQDLQRRGYDLDQKSIDTLTKFLTLLDQQRNVQEDENRLWESTYGAKQKIYEQQLALNKAYFDGVINLSQWKSEALEAALATNKLNNEISGGTLKTNIIQLYGGLVTQLKGAHPVIHALQSDFGQFFASLKKGFADSIAHVLVFGGSLKTALLDTARNAVAQLISSLIELGLEFLIVTALSKLFGITLPKKEDNGAQKQLEQMAVAVAAIGVITATQLAAINLLMGPAWALAEAVSLASFGANAAAAETGIAAVVAAGAAASTAGRFASGGLIQGKGTGTSDDILARVSNGEYIVNAKATSKNRSVLEAINRNEDVMNFKDFVKSKFAIGGLVAASVVPAFASGGYVGSANDYSTAKLVAPLVNNSVQLQVHVEHDGSTGVQVEHVDANTVRIIARQEAKSAVQAHAPGVIAADMYNPNSPTSKAVQRNLSAPRKR